MEVVGVAWAMSPWKPRTQEVTGNKEGCRKSSRGPINYPLYLEGEGQEGRVRSLFQVSSYPTMVVIDHTGKELWRGSNTPQLEEAIKYSLMRK